MLIMLLIIAYAAAAERNKKLGAENKIRHSILNQPPAPYPQNFVPLRFILKFAQISASVFS